MTTTTPATADDFATPIEDRYFDDYVPGTVHVFGSSPSLSRTSSSSPGASTPRASTRTPWRRSTDRSRD